MPERPLLLFPMPERASKSKIHNYAGSFHKPTVSRQWDKFSPKFEQLKNAFVQVHANADGVDPESVLVIETIGAIENFVSAVSKIAGFEWLGETEEENIAPDDDFYDEESHTKTLSGRLYWILSNQAALQQMVSLWTHYKDDPQIIFERGLTKFRDVFLQLKDIRRWSTQDRLEETGAISVWHEELQDTQLANLPVSCEIELWFRSDEKKGPPLNKVSLLASSKLVEKLFRERLSLKSVIMR